MKYLLILGFSLVVLLLVNELVFKREGPENLHSLGAKLRDLGARFHVAIGIAAVLIIVYFVVRFLIRMVEWR
jgi:hypothetical protein